MGPTSKDRKWMAICIHAAHQLSTCAKRKYFCIILSEEGTSAGFGYNGGPPGMQHCDEGGCPRYQQGSAPGSSYDNCIAIHAEENAIIHSSPERRKNGTLIVNGPPCYGCAKKICNSGVRRVVVIDDPSYAEAHRGLDLMAAQGIEVVVFQPNDFTI